MYHIKVSTYSLCFKEIFHNFFPVGLAKLFFAELAKKGNTLYNVMPDIVSRLSDPEVGIEEEQFRYRKAAFSPLDCPFCLSFTPFI